MKKITPTVFIARGNEKEKSEWLKKRALEYFEILTDLKYTDKGKPYLEGTGISVTHDENVTAVILTPSEFVGIDIEKVKENYPVRVSYRFFKPNEQELVKTPEDFYKVWCKKESYVKMTGEGIAGISDADIFSPDVIFTDLSREISENIGEKFVLIVCTKEKIKPEIITF